MTEPGAEDPPAPPRRAWPALALWLGVPAAVLAPLLPAWLAGKTLVWRDSVSIYAPLRHLVGPALREGRLPLWQPWSGTGYPVFAELMHGVLHPVSLLGAFLFPSDALDPLIGMCLAGAGVGAAALARGLGLSRAASAAAGLAYGLCGFTLSLSSNYVFLVGAASLPWLVAGLLRAGQSVAGRPAALAAGAAGVAAGAFSGDVQAVVVGVALGLLLAGDAGGRRGAARAGLAVVAGLALAAVQLLPAWVHLGRTDRGGAGLPFHAQAWSFPPWRLVELVSPGFFAPPGGGFDAPVYVALGSPRVVETPFAYSTYLGVAVLALAAAGLRGRRGALLGAAALAFAWLSTGDHLGASRFTGLVPLVRSFRYAEKFQGPATLCLALLAALGLERAAAARRVAARLGAAAALASLVAGVAWAWLRAPGAGTLPAGFPEAGRVAANLAAGLPHAALGGAALAACAAALARGWSRVGVAGVLVVAWAAGVAAAPAALRPGRRDARLATPPPTLAVPPPGPRLAHPFGVRARPPLPGLDEVDQVAFDEGASGVPNRNLPFRVDALEPWTGLRPARHVAVEEAFAAAPWLAARRYAATHLVIPPMGEGVAALAEATAGCQALAPDARTGAALWALPHRPWASFPPEVRRADGMEPALAVLAELTAARSGAAVVESRSSPPAAPGRVLSVERGLEWLRLEAEAAGDATLVINDAWWPGWEAEIDGREAEILPADVLVRAVRFPQGRHVVEMRYRPPEVTAGWVVSLLSAVALAWAAWRPSSPVAK